MRRKTVQRVLRFALLLFMALTLAWFVRHYEPYAIPEGDASLAPTYPPGCTVMAREIDGDDVLDRGMDVVYVQEREGTLYARYGRIRALPGDEVGSREGKLTVNGDLIGPIPLRGAPMGTVPADSLLILAISPAERRYPDSRTLGFISRERVRAIIRFRLSGG